MTKIFLKNLILLGYILALKGLVFRNVHKLSSCTKCFLFIFYVLSFFIMMLLLGDFIYVISNMLQKYNIDNIYDITNNNSLICILNNDDLIENLFRSNDGLRYDIMEKPYDCFDKLSNMNTNAFFDSQSIIGFFFRQNPKFNNKFRFTNKNNYATTHYLLVRKELSITDEVSII